LSILSSSSIFSDISTLLLSSIEYSCLHFKFWKIFTIFLFSLYFFIFSKLWSDSKSGPLSALMSVIAPQNLLLIFYIYTGCPRRNVPDYRRVFLMLKYTDITRNIYVQSWTVMEIMVREKCGLLACPRTVHVSWQVLSMSVLEYGVRWQKVSSH